MPILIFFLILEAIVTYQIGARIGFLNSIIEMIISAFLGIFILLNLKDVFAQTAASMQLGEINIARFASLNFSALFGAILIIIPGFLSDIIGFVLLTLFLVLSTINSFKGKYTNKQEFKPYKKGEENVIDAEIIDEKTIDDGTFISK